MEKPKFFIFVNPNMCMIKNIIFDYGGVLLDWNRHFLYDSYFERADVQETFRKNTGIEDFTPQQMCDWFLDNICTLEWNSLMDAGKPFAENCADLIKIYPQWRDAIAIYDTEWPQMVGGDIPGMYEQVKKLKEQGYRLYGLSNWNNVKFNTYCRNAFPVFALLEGMVISGEEGVNKPEARIYTTLLDRFGIDPKESVFIDDSQKNLDGAAVFGISGYLFTTTEDFIANFEKTIR